MYLFSLQHTEMPPRYKNSLIFSSVHPGFMFLHCMQLSFLGSCGLCLQTVLKKCRCGQIEKEVSCSKDLVCDFKCKKLKDCKFHVCNRKCCVECPPCTSTCGSELIILIFFSVHLTKNYTFSFIYFCRDISVQKPQM